MKVRLREIVLVMLILAVVGGGYVYVFVPATLERKNLRADIRLKKRALVDLAAATANAEELTHEASRVRLAIDRFTRTLSPEKRASQIIEELTSTARRNNLTIKTAEGLKIERLVDYSQLPVHMILAGDCAAFYQFLQQIEAMPAAMRITRMTLERAQEDGSVDADLAITIYFAPARPVTHSLQSASIR